MMMESRYSVIGARPDDGPSRRRQLCSTPRYTLVAASLGMLAVGIGLGFLLGYYVSPNGSALPLLPKERLREADPRISGLLLEEIDSNNIKHFLENLTSSPHLGGTPSDQQTATIIASLWKEWGFDNVQVVEHDVLLSYPNTTDPSTIELRDANLTVVFRSQLAEKPLGPQNNDSDVVEPYNAYSASCDLTVSNLIYVNYGTEDDFSFLRENKTINFSGAIVIARYGKIFRSNKVQLAAAYGASGIIMYTDPADYAVPGVADVYPESVWLPGTGVQRGTVKLDDGDPLTPSYPATKSSFRLKEESTSLPKICSHPIGYDDAKVLLEHLGGDDAPRGWSGTLVDRPYRIGPSLRGGKMTVRMRVTTSNIRRPTFTSIGVITGSLEPDRYVLLGNHHDAWVYGAIDPSSGTAAMLELARAFTAVMRKGTWRPRRSVVFCAWGSEEFGMIGSVEFVEQFLKPLVQRAVAYINVDLVLEGTDFMRAKATPLLQNAVYTAAMKVSNPNASEAAAGRASVYDSWLYYGADTINQSRPMVTIPGSGSDFAPFVQFVGIECADLRYTFSKNFTNIPSGSYPLYHTVYETNFLVSNLTDPRFNYSLALTRVWAELIRDLSDSLVIPFNVIDLADFIDSNIKSFENDYGELLRVHKLNESLGYLDHATAELRGAAVALAARMAASNRTDVAEVRLFNDQLMNAQRSFIDPNGLPGRPLIRNVVFSPSRFNAYSGSIFAGVADAVQVLSSNATEVNVRLVSQQLSVLTQVLEAAASTLRAPSDFVGHMRS